MQKDNEVIPTPKSSVPIQPEASNLSERQKMKIIKRIALLLLFLPVPFIIALSNRSSARNHQIEDLEYALSNEDPDVRLGAVVALTDYGESAVPSLKKALKDSEPNVKKEAIRALGKIGGREAADALALLSSDPDMNMRVRAIVALTEVGDPAFQHLLKALETDPFPRARMFAANAMAQLAGPGDAPEIIKRFERQDVATQMHLVIALVRIGDDEAYAGLSRLSKSPNKLLRFYVVSTIAGEGPTRKSLPILTESLRDEADEVRMWGMYALQLLNAPESYPAILDSLDDEYAYVRKEAAYTLGNLGNPDAVPHLIVCLKDPHYLVRSDAAEALGKLGDPRAVPVLKPLLDEPEPVVQIKTAEALARLNDFSGMETLIACVGSPALLYSKEASRRLKDISDKDFGRDCQAWANWWQGAKETMQQKAAQEATEAKD